MVVLRHLGQDFPNCSTCIIALVSYRLWLGIGSMEIQFQLHFMRLSVAASDDHYQ